MKKNLMMRLASGLLVAVLLTTCAISGTFAKYVTSDNAGDSARVAKFGVVVTTTGSLFGSQYAIASGNGVETWVNAHAGTVNSGNAANNVVAPGTQNDNGMTFSVTGAPEVAVKVDFVITSENGTVNTAKDIFLAQKTDLPNMTTGDAADKFDNVAVYNPIRFTLTRNGAAVVTNGTLAEVETALEKSTTHAPNTDLTETYGVYNLTWKWDFDDAGACTYDKQDTLLGDLAAGTTLVPATSLTAGTDYSLDIDFEIAITVTQVD